MSKEYVTINELEREIPYSRETIIRDLNKGCYEANKDGRTWYIDYKQAKKHFDEKAKNKKKELKEKENDESYKKRAEKYSAKVKEFDAKIRELNYKKKSGQLIEREELEEALANNLESLRSRFQNFGIKMDNCNYAELQNEIDQILREYYNAQQKALKEIDDKDG